MSLTSSRGLLQALGVLTAFLTLLVFFLERSRGR